MTKDELGKQPAFPINGNILTEFSGLTKRELFTLVMAAALRSSQGGWDELAEEIAKRGAEDADALLARLAESSGEK